MNMTILEEALHRLMIQDMRDEDCGVIGTELDRLRDENARLRASKNCEAERPLVYIVGPFRADTPWEIEQNVRRAEEHGLLIAKLGGVPVIPHTMYRFFQGSLSDAFWLEAGLALLRKCDAIAVCVIAEIALQGEGARAEIAEGKLCKFPIFFWSGPSCRGQIENWIKVWIKGHA